MSKFITVSNGDIRLNVTGTGNVILDTESGGDVLLRTGNGIFSVTGSETFIESDNLFVSDNRFTINSGELGSGVTGGEAGFEIDRGGLDNVKIVFKEGDEVFQFSDSNSDLIGLETNRVTSSSDILFDPPGTLTTDPGYSGRIGSITDVPNVDWVNSAIDNAIDEYQQSGTYQIARGTSGQTRVTTRHISDGDSDNSITLTVDGSTVGRVQKDHFDFNYLRLSTNVDIFGENPIVQTRIPGKDLVLRAETGGAPNNTGSVRVDYVFELTGQLDENAIDDILYPGFESSIVDPSGDYVEGYGTPGAYVEDFGGELSESGDDYIDRVNLYSENKNGVKIIGSAPSTGGTGIYFVNGNNTRDELISRKKSLFLSMMF